MPKKKPRMPGRTVGAPHVQRPPRESSAALRTRAETLQRVAAGELSFRDVTALAEEEARVIHVWNRRAEVARRGKGPPPPDEERPDGHMPISRTLVRDVLLAFSHLSDRQVDAILDEYGINRRWRVEEIGTAEGHMLDVATRLVALGQS